MSTNTKFSATNANAAANEQAIKQRTDLINAVKEKLGIKGFNGVVTIKDNDTSVITINGQIFKINIAGTKTRKISFIKEEMYYVYIDNIDISDNYKINFDNLSVNDVTDGIKWSIENGGDSGSGYGWGMRGGKKVKDKRSYESRPMKDLQALAKTKKIAYSGLKKAELITKLRGKK